MKQKRVLVMASWFFIALVFVGLLAFLWIYTTGLQVDVQSGESLDSFKVIVSNESSHVINNISVLQQENEDKTIGIIASLQPKESKTFLIPVQENRIIIKAKAPFHKTSEKSVFLPRPKAFIVTVQAPEKIVLEESFETIVRVCNNSSESMINIEESHDPTFFGLEFQDQSQSISKGDCKNISFYFNPLFTGPTIVIFNIKSNTLTEIIEKELTISK